MKRIKKAVLGLFFCLISGLLVAQTTEYIPVSLAVSQSTVNRYISTQWNSGNFEWEGQSYGVGYYMELENPTIALLQDKIIISMTLNIMSSVYSGSVTIEPELDIPAISTSTTEIRAEYENLRTTIDAITAFTNSGLKDIIEDKLEPIDWLIYDGGILNVLSGRISDTSELEWDNSIGFDFEVAPGELLFTVTPTILSTSPEYTFRLRRRTNNYIDFQVRSNNEIDLNSVALYYLTGSKLFETTINLSSSYDSGTGEYVVTYTQSDPWAYSLTGTNYKLHINRGGNETIWAIYLGTVYKNGSWASLAHTHQNVTSPTGD